MGDITQYRTANGNTVFQTASGNTEYQTATESMEFQTANSTKTTTRLPALSFEDNSQRTLASSTQRKFTTKRILSMAEEESQGDTPSTMQRRALNEGISTTMSKGLEPLLTAKETKNKPTKYHGTRNGIIDGWMMLMKRHLENAHAKFTPLDKGWTTVEFLENEARDHITNKSEAERDTDEKVFCATSAPIWNGI